MGMRIVKVGTANARFEEHEARVREECEELSNAISEAIEATDVDTKNKWTMNGFSTCRVVYMDASSFLPEVVATVSAAFQEEGYVVNVMTMEAGDDDMEEMPPMVMMAVLWDPKAAFGLCTNCQSTGADIPEVGEGESAAEEGVAASADPTGEAAADAEDTSMNDGEGAGESGGFPTPGFDGSDGDSGDTGAATAE